MKKKYWLMILFFGVLANSQAQKPATNNIDFDAELDKLLNYSVPLISVQELEKKINDFIILDTREKEEYEVSHIPGAIYAGYNKFDKNILNNIKKDQDIVVYCSVGSRSEKIGEKLKTEGYTNIHNLYGSIFEWANKGYMLEKNKGGKTNNIHTYNEEWSQWVSNPEIIKIW